MIKECDMKNLISILLLLFSTISCLSQSTRNDDYKLFDIETFNRNKQIVSSMRDATDTLKLVILETYEFKKEDSLIYMAKYSLVDYYQLTRNKIGGSYKIDYYYYPNYHLKIKKYFFLDRPIGIHETYSEEGELLKKTNYDQMRIEQGYPISIFDVAKSMRRDFKINIENENEILRWELVRDEDLQRVVYKVVCPAKHPDGRPLRGFTYDAITGKFIAEYRAHPLR